MKAKQSAKQRFVSHKSQWLWLLPLFHHSSSLKRRSSVISARSTPFHLKFLRLWSAIIFAIPLFFPAGYYNLPTTSRLHFSTFITCFQSSFFLAYSTSRSINSCELGIIPTYRMCKCILELISTLRRFPYLPRYTNATELTLLLLLFRSTMTFLIQTSIYVYTAIICKQFVGFKIFLLNWPPYGPNFRSKNLESFGQPRRKF